TLADRILSRWSWRTGDSDGSGRIFRVRALAPSGEDYGDSTSDLGSVNQEAISAPAPISTRPSTSPTIRRSPRTQIENAPLYTSPETPIIRPTVRPQVVMRASAPQQIPSQASRNSADANANLAASTPVIARKIAETLSREDTAGQ